MEVRDAYHRIWPALIWLLRRGHSRNKLLLLLGNDVVWSGRADRYDILARVWPPAVYVRSVAEHVIMIEDLQARRTIRINSLLLLLRLPNVACRERRLLPPYFFPTKRRNLFWLCANNRRENNIETFWKPNLNYLQLINSTSFQCRVGFNLIQLKFQPESTQTFIFHLYFWFSALFRHTSPKQFGTVENKT